MTQRFPGKIPATVAEHARGFFDSDITTRDGVWGLIGMAKAIHRRAWWDIEELVLQAVTTPSVDAPFALDVLADVLLERGLLRSRPKRVGGSARRRSAEQATYRLRKATMDWAREATDLPRWWSGTHSNYRLSAAAERLTYKSLLATMRDLTVDRPHPLEPNPIIMPPQLARLFLEDFPTMVPSAGTYRASIRNVRLDGDTAHVTIDVDVPGHIDGIETTVKISPDTR